MRKITLLLFTFFFTSLGFSQLPLEGFEGTFPPANWAVFDIGVGGTTNSSTNSKKKREPTALKTKLANPALLAKRE